MTKRILVETGFLLALNPRDRHHDWALQLLNQAKRNNVYLFISAPALLELTLILRARGVDDEKIGILLESIDTAIRLYTRPRYVGITLESAILAAKLRCKYPELTFFDSYHAALAIINGLEYGDLDPLVREVVLREHRS